MGDSITYTFDGPGIAGYAIFIPIYVYEKWRRRLEQFVAKTPLGQAGVKKWKKGDKFEIPGVGEGEILEVGKPFSRVKVDDNVPFKYPTNGLFPRKERKRRMVQSSGPRRQVFVYGVNGLQL